MYFHRAIGKITFPLIAIAFVALSVQTTWAFLNTALPHETWLYKVLGLAVFELGAFCWFSLLTSGAENVIRTLIALAMTVICVGGVATAAIYQLGSQMTDLGYKMDPSFLQWAPLCVLIGFVSTLIATLLYMAASPHVAFRFSHLAATGQEPQAGTRIEMLPQMQLTRTQNVPQIAAPRSAAQDQPRGNFIDGLRGLWGRTTKQDVFQQQQQPAQKVLTPLTQRAYSRAAALRRARQPRPATQARMTPASFIDTEEVEVPTGPLASEPRIKPGNGAYRVNHPKAKGGASTMTSTTHGSGSSGS